MQNSVKLIKVYNTGYCKGFAKIANRKDSWEKVGFSARVFLLKHPEKGLILFDTGYSEHFFQKTKKFPAKFYAKLLPVQVKKSLREHLEEDGISEEEISFIFLSHFHADHVGGLLDFPNTPWIYSFDEWKRLRERKGFSALLKGWIPGLATNPPAGSLSLKKEDFIKELYSPILSIDLFSDQSLYALFLPGHTKYQIGLAFEDTLLVSDTAWSEKALREDQRPHFIGTCFQEERKSYEETFSSLQKLLRKKDFQLFTSHKKEAI